MATLSSPDSDDPLGIGKKMSLRRHCPQIKVTQNNNISSHGNHHHHHHHLHKSAGKIGSLSHLPNDKLAHKHVEEDIETFLETFKHKTWCVDSSNKLGILDRRPSSDSGDSSGWTSSALSTTDDLSTDSPDRDTDFPPYGASSSAAAGGGGGATTATASTSTRWQDREGIIAESRRIARWAWRQSRFAGSQETPCACSYHPPSSVMDETSQQYKVMDVAPLLQSRYAILTGAKAKNGAPVMTFPATPGQQEVPDEDYGKLVTYLCGITPLHELEGGFVIVIDRRQGGWGDVKSILLKLSAFFPMHIQVVFLLQPSGFFQRAFADIRSKFVKEELEFKVVLCDGPKDIEDYIETSHLTTDVGGELVFDANEWTEHRSAVEKYSTNTAAISASLSAVVKKMEERESPNDVPGTEAILRCCIAERKELLDDIDSAMAHGDTLLKCIKGEQQNTPVTKLCHVLQLERLLVQLDESRTGFGEFWQRHESKLKQCLTLRQFEEEFKLSQFSMERNIEMVQEMMEQLGNSESEVQTLMEEFEAMELNSQKDLDQADKMRGRGQQLIMDEHYAVDSIRPKCMELQRMCEQYKELLRKRREMLTKSHDLHDRLERASRWCDNGVTLLTNQPADKLLTVDGAQAALRDVEEFLKTSRELKLSNPKEFRVLFEPVMTNETRATVQEVLKRREDVQSMYAKRKENLHLVIHPHKPRANLRQEQTPSGRHSPRWKDSAKLETDQNDTGHQRQGSDGKVQPVSLEKSARYRPATQPSSDSNQSESTNNTANKEIYLTNLPHTLNHNGSQSGSNSSLNQTQTNPRQETDMLQAKRRHVMAELIDTEMSYVHELEQILQGYYDVIDQKSQQMMIPPPLLGQKHVLFGNLPEIYQFHKDIFLQELKNCQDAPTRVGKCFVNRKEEFQMYSIYCQNKPRSEALRITIGDTNPFFKECQNRLGHKLPLGAYLLKPVQRITKYQLLLKEMLRFSRDNPEMAAGIQEALDTMLSVLAYLNDSMHQVAINGFNENIADQGRLLLHGSFRVWTEHKHDGIRGLRLRAMQRHVFLYQRVLLLCKKKEDNHSDGPSYSFKNKLKMSQVGLTEKIKGDKRKFELWLRGREEVYIIQAPDLDTKEVWVSKIKNVLLSQFDEIKECKQHASHTATEDSTQSSRMSSDSSDYSIESWKSPEPGKSTVPVGLEMSSPLTTPSSPPYQMDEDLEEDDQCGGWSSGEFSNEEEEHYTPKIEPSYKEHFVSLSDYYAMDTTELALTEGDEVEVMRVDSNGWWYARHLQTNQEGWVPSTFLEPISRVSSLYSSSDSLSVTRSDMTRSRSGSPYYRSCSPLPDCIPETTV